MQRCAAALPNLNGTTEAHAQDWQTFESGRRVGQFLALQDLRFYCAVTHLERYSRSLRCAEIYSSFHRPHAAATYAKWRDSTPAHFRFAVKMPRTITHDLKLRAARAPLLTFMEYQTDGLAE